MSNSRKTGSNKSSRKDRVAEIANTLEWLITAFILAFVFRTFVMEAFRIPTGSMADTLKGDHLRLRCSQCGYRYDHGVDQRDSRLLSNRARRANLKLYTTRCPSCGHYQPAGGAIAKGDRILVLKCLYQFLEPKRWDVIVFKNPLDPTINYIKRLIGRPGETVEIIDGDIYIYGQISRKPHNVQNELWMPIYDNDHQPARPREPSFNEHPWRQPFKNTNDSKWKLNDADPTQFRLDSPPAQTNTLIYDSSIGNDFRTTYAYNDVDRYNQRPYCSDLKTRFYARSTATDGSVGIEMSKYQTNYKARVDLTGEMVITKTTADKETVELARKVIEPPAINEPTLVELANVDHRLIFRFGPEFLIHDLGLRPNDAGQIKPNIEPEVKIFGSGKLTLSHIAIFRDTHYTTAKFANGPKSSRATQTNPLTLAKDEFFVLGDNSPNSEDGRWWSKQGKGNNGRLYRQGIVPREYLVGKALFVYWPSGFRPFARSRFAIIPNIGRMRFIYGGSNKTK